MTGSPDPSAYDFPRHDFATLEARFSGVVGTTFRTFPSYPQRFIERMLHQPVCEVDMAGVEVEPLRSGQPQKLFTKDDLHPEGFVSRDLEQAAATSGSTRSDTRGRDEHQRSPLRRREQ
jgi:hypothetical protein